MFKKSLLFLSLATIVTPSHASVFGVLAKFDVINDTGSTAHGFESNNIGERSEIQKEGPAFAGL